MKKNKNDKYLKKLEAWLLYWTDVLRLNQWEITIKVSSQKEIAKIIDDFQNMANMHEPNTLTSVIYVLPEEEIMDDPLLGENADIEQMLVHELVHLHFAFTRSPQDDRRSLMAEEQPVQCLSRALLDLKRGLK